MKNEGPPALYQLNTERKYIDGNQKKVKQRTYGRRDNYKQNKVILIVGETGSGKTTIINTMTNYLLGVKFEHEGFYQITEEEDDDEEEDQSESKTSEITVYEVFVEESPTSLTIIDTPGYANTKGYEKDAEVAEYLSRLFTDEDGIHYIDAVCFVMKASQNRLSGKELYIFHSVLSLFGRDIENNIVFLLTHSDGRRPTNAINCIKKAEIPCRRGEDKEPIHFLFNNQQKEKRDKQHEHLDRSAWEMGERSINQFFTLLEEKNRKSVQMTLDVLKERRRLEACVSNLMERINEKELKMKELTDIQEALRQNRDMIQKCENFEFKLNKVSKEKVPIEKPWWNKSATCCNVCEENCHDEYSCWWVSPRNLSKCNVMINNSCIVCTGKCEYSSHVKENKKYVIKTEKSKMSFVDLKKKYEPTGFQNITSFDREKYEKTKQEHKQNIKLSENITKIEEILHRDLQKIINEKSGLLTEAYMTITNLSKIALKADSAFTLQYLNLLITKLKDEGKDEWVIYLEDMKNAAEQKKYQGALRHAMDFTRKWNKIKSYVTGEKNATNSIQNEKAKHSDS